MLQVRWVKGKVIFFLREMICIMEEWFVLELRAPRSGVEELNQIKAKRKLLWEKRSSPAFICYSHHKEKTPKISQAANKLWTCCSQLQILNLDINNLLSICCMLQTKTKNLNLIHFTHIDCVSQ